MYNNNLNSLTDLQLVKRMGNIVPNLHMRRKKTKSTSTENPMLQTLLYLVCGLLCGLYLEGFKFLFYSPWKN